MALTDATRLANFSSGVGTDGTLDTNNLNISGVATAATLKVGSAITAFGGIVTATTFSGTLSGNATSATTATNAEGLTGTPDITVRNVTGVAATFTGVLTYEDVTNVDSTGIVTAKSGVVVSGGDLKVGSAFTVGQAGVVTATQFVGDGSELTGVISGVELQFAGASVGTAITNINFSGFSSVTAPTAGLSTVTVAGWEVYDTWLYGGG